MCKKKMYMRKIVHEIDLFLLYSADTTAQFEGVMMHVHILYITLLSYITSYITVN